MAFWTSAAERERRRLRRAALTAVERQILARKKRAWRERRKAEKAAEPTVISRPPRRPHRDAIEELRQLRRLRSMSTTAREAFYVSCRKIG